MPPNFWQKHNLLSYCLTPFSTVYRIIIFLRRLLYKLKIKKTTHFKIPIIVVGNITIGGTGKTPLVIWLASFLKQQGYRPGIVSRGYGGKTIYPCVVDAKSSAEQVGDEPLLIVRNTQCPLVVDPNRVNAVKKLLTDCDCNIVISDDGLQHYALGRDMEIAVVDSARKWGNGFCLPAGPLREPVSRLNTVDFIVFNSGNQDISLPCSSSGSVQDAGKSTQRAQAMETAIVMRLTPFDFCQVINPHKTRMISDFKNKTIHAVAGIGNPQRFFDSLRAMGLMIIEHPFADHYQFQFKDFSFAPEETIIVMTEKDAVKCEVFADARFWYLPVRATLPEDFGIQILNKMNRRRNVGRIKPT